MSQRAALLALVPRAHADRLSLSLVLPRLGAMLRSATSTSSSSPLPLATQSSARSSSSSSPLFSSHCRASTALGPPQPALHSPQAAPTRRKRITSTGRCLVTPQNASHAEIFDAVMVSSLSLRIHAQLRKDDACTECLHSLNLSSGLCEGRVGGACETHHQHSFRQAHRALGECSHTSSSLLKCWDVWLALIDSAHRRELKRSRSWARGWRGCQDCNLEPDPNLSSSSLPPHYDDAKEFAWNACYAKCHE
ncbi:hypothetical protein V8E36_000510 [Tilletia maclaganii]